MKLDALIYHNLMSILVIYIVLLQEVYSYLSEGLSKVASAHGERLLSTKGNPISLGKEHSLTTCNGFCFIVLTRSKV